MLAEGGVQVAVEFRPKMCLCEMYTNHSTCVHTYEHTSKSSVSMVLMVVLILLVVVVDTGRGKLCLHI